MGVGKIFQGALVDSSKSFVGGPKSGEICFLPLKMKKTAFFAEMFKFLPPSDHARNQLRTPRKVKSFLRGAQIF